MKKSLIGTIPAVLIALMAIGCLVSGTFVVDYEFSFSPENNEFYHEFVDVTDEADWEDHKDDIDEIELLGLEVSTSSSTSFTVSFYIDPASEPTYTNASEVMANATVVLENVSFPEGAGTLTYGSSLPLIQNVATVKSLAKDGQFHMYALIKGAAPGDVINFEKVVVVITIGASG